MEKLGQNFLLKSAKAHPLLCLVEMVLIGSSTTDP